MNEDDELREQLRDIDESEDIDVSEWEADFIESVVYNYGGPLSDKQREKAEDIVEKHLG